MGNWLASCPDAILNAKDCTFETGSLHRISKLLPHHLFTNLAQFTYTVGHPEITSNDMIDLLIKVSAVCSISDRFAHLWS
jgi:hypothetical protein